LRLGVLAPQRNGDGTGQLNQLGFPQRAGAVQVIRQISGGAGTGQHHPLRRTKRGQGREPDAPSHDDALPRLQPQRDQVPRVGPPVQVAGQHLRQPQSTRDNQRLFGQQVPLHPCDDRARIAAGDLQHLDHAALAGVERGVVAEFGHGAAPGQNRRAGVPRGTQDSAQIAAQPGPDVGDPNA
jgi:hypothetical protein